MLNYLHVEKHVCQKRTQYYVCGEFGLSEERLSEFYEDKVDAERKMYEIEAEYFG